MDSLAPSHSYNHSNTGSGFLQLHVGTGEDSRKFSVPSILLARLSDKLREVISAASTKQNGCHHCTPPTPNALVFESDSPAAWDVFLHWAQHHELPRSIPGVHRDVRFAEYSTTYHNINSLIDIWLFGEKLQLPALQDLVMLEILKVANGCEPFDLDKAFHPETSTEVAGHVALLRRVVVETMHCQRTDESTGWGDWKANPPRRPGFLEGCKTFRDEMRNVSLCLRTFRGFPY